MKKRIMILMVFLWFSLLCDAQEKNVKLGSLSFSLEEVFYDKPLKTKEQNVIKKIEEREYMTVSYEEIYTNYSKTYFLIESIEVVAYEVSSGMYADAPPNSRLTLYSKEGKEIWTRKISLGIERCRISDDGEYVHTYQAFPIDEIYKFFSYNRKGEIIKEIDGLGDFFSGKTGKLVCYLTNKPSLVCINFEETSTWERDLQDINSSIEIVSDDDKLCVFNDKTVLYCVRNDGQILWSLDNKGKIFGNFDISYDNKYLLWLEGQVYNIIDMEAGEFIGKDLEITNEKNEKEGANHCKFLPNSNHYVIIIPLGMEGSLINFYTSNGNCYKREKVDELLIQNLGIELLNGSMSFYFDNKKVWTEKPKP